MVVLIDARPPGLDILYRAGNTLTVELTWPTGELDDRTFTSSLGGTSLDVAINGDTMTIVASDTVTGAQTAAAAWQLVDTTDGDSEVVLQGTWTPSDAPQATSSTSIELTEGDAQVDVTVVSGQASIVALDDRIDVLEQARPSLNQWYTADDWDDFTEVPVSSIDNTIDLTAEGGVGTVSAVAGGGSNEDRRLFIYNDLDDVADAEVYVDLTLGDQAGIAFRYAEPGAAVIVWSNIVFAANGQVLQGVWEFDGTTLLGTNKVDVDLWGFPSPVLSAEGDGEVVTVKTVRPHQIQAGELIHFDETVGSFGQVFVEDVLDATTFTFSDSTVGTWTGGRWRWVIRTGRRHLAARLVGNRVTWKQWLPGEPEPSWADPDRAVSVLLPDTLIARGGPPPEAGGVGLVVAHLNTSGFVGFNDFSVKVLD